VRGSGSILRQYQYDRFGGVDGVDDLIGIEPARRYISGRNPAPESMSLQCDNYRIGNGGILRGVADEDVG
jgi:hypothetical protein